MENVGELVTPVGREWLLGILQTEIVTITVEKLPGILNVVSCTLMENDMPNELKPENAGLGFTRWKESLSSTQMAVFNTQSKGWYPLDLAKVRQVRYSQGTIS